MPGNIGNKSSTLAMVSGIWVHTGATYTLSLAVDPNGVMHGSDTNGCVYNGTVGILDRSYNLYRAQIDIDACYPVTVSTSGLATLTDGVMQNDTLSYAVTGYTAALSRDAFVERLTRH